MKWATRRLAVPGAWIPPRTTTTTQDLQVSSLQIVNGINTAITTNAASAENYGAEAQVAASVTSDFNVNVGVAYTHARYQDFPAASYNAIATTGLTAGLNTTSLPKRNPPPADGAVHPGLGRQAYRPRSGLDRQCGRRLHA